MDKINIPEDMLHKILLSFTLLLVVIGIGGVALAEVEEVPLNHGTLAAAAAIVHADPQEFIDSSSEKTAILMVLNFGGYVLSFYVFYLMFEYLVSGRLADAISGVKEMKKIGNLTGHYIVCGAGRVGYNIGRRLTEKKREVVFIEKDTDVIKKLKSEGHFVIDVGPIDEDVLISAGIKKARGLAASLGDDSKNLLLVLTARDLNKRLKIAVRAGGDSIVSKLKKAGADLIILPELVGGEKLADAMCGRIDKDHVIIK
jgi:voltage-gated potassium channel